jgi:hypothetical protein
MLFSHGLRAASIYAKETSPESFACKLREKIKPNRESLTNHGSKKKKQKTVKRDAPRKKAAKRKPAKASDTASSGIVHSDVVRAMAARRLKNG